MKKNILILLVALTFIGSSCEDFLNVNEVNPNSASKVDAKYILPSTINAVAATMNSPRNFEFVYLWHGLWSISSGYSQPQALVQYKLLNSSYQGLFTTFYTTANNLDLIEKGATDPKDAYYSAVAKIMKVYIFQNLVDLYGDVPYTQCFLAPVNMKPAYDPQQTIYEDLVLKLDAAIAQINNAPTNVNPISGSSDIMYAGDMGLWKKFANTIKLRMLVHQSGMAGRTSYITTAIATTAAEGYIGAGEGAMVNPGYLVSTGKMNPFYETFYNAAGTNQSDGVTYYYAGKDGVDFLLVANDPRLAKFYTPYSGVLQAGNVFGSPVSAMLKQTETSRLGYFKSASGIEDPGTLIGNGLKSTSLLTDFESLFIQAEAAYKGLIPGSAQGFYESAIFQSCQRMGIDAGTTATYIAQSLPTVSYSAAGNKLQVIITQKWAALNGVAPVEIWTDYRRTGFPSNLHFSLDAAKAGPGFPPVRLYYPQNEINVNNANVLALGTIDAFTSKIFWQNR